MFVLFKSRSIVQLSSVKFLTYPIKKVFIEELATNDVSTEELLATYKLSTLTVLISQRSFLQASLPMK